jgi:hypothetical protein
MRKPMTPLSRHDSTRAPLKKNHQKKKKKKKKNDFASTPTAPATPTRRQNND